MDTSWERIHISHHAFQRYLFRVDAECEDANAALLRMWNCGLDASNSDLAMYGTKREVGIEYRIGKAVNNQFYLMIVTDKTMLTVMQIQVSLRVMRKVLPKRFRQRSGKRREG